MIIDWSEWTEYLGEDCGAPPFQTELEYMYITQATVIRKLEEEILPPAWTLIPGTVPKHRTFWRLKK